MKIKVPTYNYYSKERGVEEIGWSVATTPEKAAWIIRTTLKFVGLMILGCFIAWIWCLLPWGN
jgi:hypothetical protein